MSNSKILFTGIIGLATGLVIGVLFAPAKGSKTRKRLKKKIMNIADIYQNELFNSIEDMQEQETEESPLETEEVDQENKQ